MKKIEQSQFSLIVSLLTVFLVVFLDRVSKLCAIAVLAPGESIPVIQRIFHITLVHNTGIAFGLFRDRGVVFLIIPLIAVALLIYNIYYYKKNQEQLSNLYMFAFSLILAGALGNLFDRIMYGYVIDFFDFRIWPVFNIADSAITIGAVLIAWTCLFVPYKNRR